MDFGLVERRPSRCLEFAILPERDDHTLPRTGEDPCHRGHGDLVGHEYERHIARLPIGQKSAQGSEIGRAIVRARKTSSTPAMLRRHPGRAALPFPGSDTTGSNTPPPG